MTSQDFSVAIDRLLRWSSLWQLRIANEKCLVLRITNHRCISSCLHPTSQAAQSRCTVVRPLQKSIGKWEIRPPVKS